MKVIVAGTRTIQSYEVVKAAIKKSGFPVTEIVSGGLQGVDGLGVKYARYRRLPVRMFLPDWQRYKKAAGVKRNSQMADYADALIAVWDGKSRGTKDMINKALSKGLKVYVHKVA